MDRSGNTVIQPKYDDVGHFFNGLARARVGGLWGFINEAGVMVIPPRFIDAGDFRETLAPVRVGRKWGYIDQNGRMVVAPTFQGAATFREGLARVEMWDWIQCRDSVVYGKEDAPDYVYGIQSDIRHDMNNQCFPLQSRVGYINGTGHFAVYPRFAEGHDFFDGLAAVRTDRFGRFGFVDRTGVVVIDFQFDEARDFSEGLAAVRVGRKRVAGIRDPGLCGYIDRTGTFTISPQFVEASDFSEGLARVSFWGPQRSGYIDKTGKFVIPARFIFAEPFSEGLAKVCYEVHSTFWRCEYIDKSGKAVIDSVQADGPFSGGLAIASEWDETHQPAGLSVYIDKAGHVIAPTEVDVSHFIRPHSKQK